jgi:DNA-binding MarR family transcriptional regulator
MFTRIIAGLARMLRDEELTVAQVAALYLIDEQGSSRVSQIAGVLSLSASAASRLVDGLVTRGLVVRQEDPSDRRAKALSLTARGRRFVAETSEERVRVIAEAARSLPEEVVAKMMAAADEFRRP